MALDHSRAFLLLPADLKTLHVIPGLVPGICAFTLCPHPEEVA
jgi:hypothetical protein